MFSAEDGTAVVVVKHVSGEGALQVITIFILQGLALFVLFLFFGRFGGHGISLGFSSTDLFLFGGLRLVLSTFDGRGRSGGGGSND